MRRARGRGRGALASRSAGGSAPAGFGGASSSSSSSASSSPRQAQKRPRASLGGGRVFLPAAPASNEFLQQLKTQIQEEIPGKACAGEAGRGGSFDEGDPTTTNLFVGNLNPETDEAALQWVFGRYGPVASIKVMWPRTPEEHTRGYNSGFVSFMHRADAESAYANLLERIDGHEVRLAWGKAVRREPSPRPPLPGQVYGGAAARRFALDEAARRGDSGLPMVLVQPPLDLGRRREIDGLAMQAVQEGGVEAVIARQRAEGRRGLGFLWEEVGEDGRGSEDGNYFRWRARAFRDGGTATRWRTAPLALIDGGPLWDPPTCSQPLGNPPFDEEAVVVGGGDGGGEEVRTAPIGLGGAAGAVPVDVNGEGELDSGIRLGSEQEESDDAMGDVVAAEVAGDGTRVPGSTAIVDHSSLDAAKLALLESVAALDERLDAGARAELHRLLDALDTTNGAVAAAMVFCIDHSRRAGDIAATLARRLLGLAIAASPPPRGLALLYLATDLLANGDAGGGAHAHRARLAALAPVAFGEAVSCWLAALPGRIAVADAAKGVKLVFDAWEELRFFDAQFVDALRDAALGTHARAIAEDLAD